jgi:hypothetical protein
MQLIAVLEELSTSFFISTPPPVLKNAPRILNVIGCLLTPTQRFVTTCMIAILSLAPIVKVLSHNANNMEGTWKMKKNMKSN